MTSGLPEGCRILIVEDEFLIALFLQEALEDEGCRIVGPVGRVSEAVLLVGQGGIDAALLDAGLAWRTGDRRRRCPGSRQCTLRLPLRLWTRASAAAPPSPASAQEALRAFRYRCRHIRRD